MVHPQKRNYANWIWNGWHKYLNLNEFRIQAEADSILQHSRVLDMSSIREYVDDLKSLLEEADSADCKAMLRSFIKRITIDGSKVTVEYRLPIPPDNERKRELVLPTVKLGGAEVAIGRTFRFVFSLA